MIQQLFDLGHGHVIRLTVTDRLKFEAIGPDGDGRFLEVFDGGGHIQCEVPGSITTNTGLELDGDGRVIFHAV